MAMRCRMGQDFLRSLVRGHWTSTTNKYISIVTDSYDPLQPYIDWGLFSTWTAATEYNGGQIVNFTDAGGPGVDHYYEAILDGAFSSDTPGDMSGQWTTNPGDKITEQNVTGETPQVWRYLGPRTFLPYPEGRHYGGSCGSCRIWHGFVPVIGTWTAFTSYDRITQGPHAVVPTVPDGRIYINTTYDADGTSGGTEPVWSGLVPGQTIEDGTFPNKLQWLASPHHPSAFSTFAAGAQGAIPFYGSPVTVDVVSAYGASYLTVTNKEQEIGAGVLAWEDLITELNAKYAFIYEWEPLPFEPFGSNDNSHNCNIIAMVDLDDSVGSVEIPGAKPTIRGSAYPNALNGGPGDFPNNVQNEPYVGAYFAVEIAWY